MQRTSIPAAVRAGIDSSTSEQLNSVVRSVTTPADLAVDLVDPSQSPEDESASKQKVTLYLPAALYRQLKTRAAVEMETMSAVTEKALHFLIEHPETVEGVMGRTHQLHHCPACAHPFVIQGDEVVSVQSSPRSGWILDDDWDSIPHEQDKLVTC
ncbi:MAG: hypothetical protein HC924_01990 [Synechococcaceae cyanobacterium SM2_3_2]|nr:hypothetical protein [Synechococcaceae cyanobacterium SM2_3_2]